MGSFGICPRRPEMIRPALVRWLLASLALSAVAILWEAPRGDFPSTPLSPAAVFAPPRADPEPDALSEHRQVRGILSAPKRNIFAFAVPPVRAAAGVLPTLATPSQLVLPSPISAPPAPLALPMSPATPPLPTLVGTMRQPDGRWMVFLQEGEDVVQAKPNAQLASGYRVEQLTDQVLRLSHPSLAQPAAISLLPPEGDGS